MLTDSYANANTYAYAYAYAHANTYGPMSFRTDPYLWMYLYCV